MDPDELLTITVVDGGLEIIGEIDGHTSPRLAEALATVADRPVRLDLSGVEFVDSSGLRVLIEAHQRAGETGGSITLVELSGPVARLLEVSGVDTYLNVDRR
jgi:anti-sigma B factor antagonist